MGENKLKNFLDNDPELKESIIKHFREMQKPENLKPLVDKTVKFIELLRSFQEEKNE